VRDIDLSVLRPPSERGDAPMPHYYLVTLDPTRADLSRLPTDLATLRGAGGFRVRASSEALTP